MSESTQTKSSPLLKITFILCTVVFVLVGIRTISNPDFWTHLASGRVIAEEGIVKQDSLSFTRSGETWIDAYWLYDLGLFKLYQVGGAPLATIIHIASALVGLFLLLKSVPSRISPLTKGIAVLLLTWLLAPRFEIRAELFTLVFPALFIYLLSRTRMKAPQCVILFLAQALWTNLCPTFWAGPFIVVLFAIQSIFSSQKLMYHSNKALLLAALCVCATFLNPYFLALHKTVLAFATDPAALFSSHWISTLAPQFNSPLAKRLLTATLVIGAAGLVAEKRKLPIAITTMAVLSAFVMVARSQYTILYPVLMFPYLMICISALGEFLGDSAFKNNANSQSRSISVVALITSILAIGSGLCFIQNCYYASTGSFSAFGVGENLEAYPHDAAEVINHPEFPTQAMNLISDGGFLAWNHPERKVFLDDRGLVYGAAFYQKALRALTLADGNALNELLEQYDIDAQILSLITPHTQTILINQLQTGLWRMIYADGTTAILVRNISQYSNLINATELQQKGLQHMETARTEALAGNSLPVRTIGSANCLAAGKNMKRPIACLNS